MKNEEEYWKHSVLCYVLGSNPPFHVINGFFCRIWKAYSIEKVVHIKRGLFVVRIKDEESKLVVLQSSFQRFDEKPFVISPWSVHEPIEDTEVTQVSTRIQFPELLLRYWNPTVLCKLAS